MGHTHSAPDLRDHRVIVRKRSTAFRSALTLGCTSPYDASASSYHDYAFGEDKSVSDRDEKRSFDPPPLYAYSSASDIPEDGAASAYREFLQQYPQYQLTWILDALRRSDFARLDRNGETYVDYMGGSLYPESLIRVHTGFLQRNILGNTHSVSNSYVSIQRCSMVLFRLFLGIFHLEFGLLLDGSPSVSQSRQRRGAFQSCPRFFSRWRGAPMPLTSADRGDIISFVSSSISMRSLVATQLPSLSSFDFSISRCSHTFLLQVKIILNMCHRSATSRSCILSRTARIHRRVHRQRDRCPQAGRRIVSVRARRRLRARCRRAQQRARHPEVRPRSRGTGTLHPGF